MATKTAAKKPTTKRKAPAKTTVKAAPKAATKPKTTSRVSKAKTPVVRSFRVSPSPQPFFTFRVTKQTVYWILLLLVIVALQLWIIKLQLDIAVLSDSLLLAE